MHLQLESPIQNTPRVQQLRGLFDLPTESTSRVEWTVHLPLDQRPWNLGLIVGPSGCGKSTIARHLFSDAYATDGNGVPSGLSDAMKEGVVIDGFPDSLSIRDIALLLSSVGFASPPSWLRPFHVLSTGQKFRVTLAWMLASAPTDKTIVFDEYTSVVDRTVAQIGSAAISKVIRQRGQRFVAITCHDDVEDWLNPDWVFRPAENLFAWRRLRRRPAVHLEIVRAKASAWGLFAPHHYLNTKLAPSAVCFLASWKDRPVAFSAWLPHVGPGPKTRREHRTVTLPDYQGVGIGHALSDFVASLWTGLGYRAISTTTHPAIIRSRLHSSNWKMHRKPSFATGNEGRLRHATTRLTAGFTYVGPSLAPVAARALLERVNLNPPGSANRG